VTKRDRVSLAVVAGLVGAAVAQELAKPRDERTWHGRVIGLVPYDLRPPTVGRIRAALWDNDDPSLLVPHPFGVGWTVNVRRVVTLLRPG